MGSARKGTMRKPLSTFAWPWTCARASCKPLPACFGRLLLVFFSKKKTCFIDCFSRVVWIVPFVCGGKLLQEEYTLVTLVCTALSRVLFQVPLKCELTLSLGTLLLVEDTILGSLSIAQTHGSLGDSLILLIWYQLRLGLLWNFRMHR